MRKIFSLFFLLCTIYSITLGQTQNLILTKEQNIKWLDSLKTFSLDQQLILIKERLLTDTNIFVRQFYNDRIRATDPVDGRVYGYGKPTLIIGGYPMIIENNTEKTKIVGLTKLLTKYFIKDLSILSPNDPKTTAIYGSAGMSGIIIMTLTKKKQLKKFKKLNSNS